MTERLNYLGSAQFKENQAAAIEKVKEHLKDDKIDFTYMNNDIKTLARIVLRLHQKENAKILIVGTVGAGKTTLCRLLEKELETYTNVVSMYEDEQVPLAKTQITLLNVLENDSEVYTILDGMTVNGKEPLHDIHIKNLKNAKCIQAVPKLEFLGLRNVAEIEKLIIVRLDKLSLYVPETVDIQTKGIKKFAQKEKNSK